MLWISGRTWTERCTGLSGTRSEPRLRQLSLRAREEGVSSVALFEGWDAAGKGGVIRRVSKAMDVQDYRIVPIGVPTGEELARHYLWRFWCQLPRASHLLIFR